MWAPLLCCGVCADLKSKGEASAAAAAVKSSAAASTVAPDAAVSGKAADSFPEAAEPSTGCCGKRAKVGGAEKAEKGSEKEAEAPEVKVPFSRLLALCKDKAALFPVGIVCSSLVGGIMPCFGARRSVSCPCPAACDVISFVRLVTLIGSSLVWFAALALASIIAAFLRPPSEMDGEIRKWRAPTHPPIYPPAYPPTPTHPHPHPSAHRCLIFLGIAVGSFGAGIGQMWALGVIGADLAKNARAAAFRQILRMEMAFFDQEENSSSRLTMKLEEEAVYIRGAVSDQVSVIAQNLTVLAAGFIIAFCYSWKLSLVIISTLPVRDTGGPQNGPADLLRIKDNLM